MSPALVEGIDFYMEDGKLVFTAAYHQKRGYCCNSKCRHCPYRDKGALGVADAAVRISGLPRPRTSR
jgi:hypothetical protein